MGEADAVASRHGSDLILEVDASGRVRRFGPGARVLGLPDEPGMAIWELLASIHPEDTSRVRTLAAASQSQPGLTARDRLRFRRPGGVWIELDVEIRPLPDGALAVYVQRWATTAPPDSWGRHLLDAAPAPLGLLSAEGTFVAANRALCNLLGYEEMELHRRTPLSLTHPEEHAIAARLNEVMAAGAISAEAEVRWLRSDGSPITVVERRGRATEGPMAGVLISLSEVRVTPPAIEQRVAPPTGVLPAGREESLASSVLEAARTIVLAVDGAGVIRLANRAAVTAASDATADLTGRTIDELFPPPPGREGAADLVRRALAHERITDADAALAAPDGIVHVLSWTVGLVEESGQPTLAVMTGIDTTERQATLADLSHRAFHDPLTHLPNRNLLRERITHALTRLERTGSDLAVLFIDLNHFKAVNDLLGHEVGDRVLALLATRLEAAVRPSDTVARLGGDEFVVLCEDIADAHAAVDIAGRVVEAVETPIRVNGEDVAISASVGIAFARHSGADPEALLRQADAAMYEAKRRGGESIAGRPTATEPVAELTEDDVRAAVEGDGIVVLFQPAISLVHGRVTGIEALVRLRHPTLGLLAPSAFLPVAERTDLILRIGARVMGEVAEQVAAWQALGADVEVSVNLSHRELAEPGTADRIARSLEQAGAASASLVVEVPEHVLLATSDEAVRELHALKALGVKIAVDDAGTGFTSASLVRELPVDQVKVDARFVRELGNGEAAPVVASILRLARTLDLRTVAEGVETAPQLAALRSLGCEAAQGYFLAPPQPAEVISRLLGPDLRWPTPPDSV